MAAIGDLQPWTFDPQKVQEDLALANTYEAEIARLKGHVRELRIGIVEARLPVIQEIVDRLPADLDALMADYAEAVRDEGLGLAEQIMRCGAMSVSTADIHRTYRRSGKLWSWWQPTDLLDVAQQRMRYTPPKSPPLTAETIKAAAERRGLNVWQSWDSDLHMNAGVALVVIP